MALDRPHLPARSFTGYKDVLSPRRFSNNSLPLFLFPSPLPPSCTAPSCLRPRRAPLTPLPGPLVPTEPIRRGQWENAAARPADSYSLDASATLSRRPSDPSTPDSGADEASGVPAGHRRIGHATALDAGPPSQLRPPIHHTSCLHRGRPRPRQHADWLRHRCVTAASLLRHHYVVLSPISTTAGFGQGSDWVRRKLRCDQANGEKCRTLKNGAAVRRSRLKIADVAGKLGSSEAPAKIGPFVLIGGNGD
jgi:hypothetical protein